MQSMTSMKPTAESGLEKIKLAGGARDQWTLDGLRYPYLLIASQTSHVGIPLGKLRYLPLLHTYEGA